MKKVYLVRHGQTDSNHGGVMLGEAAALTEQGRNEAVQVAGRIERIGVNALISSPFQRTIDTASAIAAGTGLSIEESDLFIEWRRPSVMIGQSWRDPKMRQLDDEVLTGYGMDPAYRHSDEETFIEIRDRARAALAFLKEHSAETICVVSHGIFLRVLFATVAFGDAFGPEQFKYAFRHLRMGNTGITTLMYEEQDGWIAQTWSDMAHLG